MTISPMISVILPVFNGEKYLKESISSIINQTFKDFELIVINDGSSDKSKEIILSYKDDRIVYIENETNIGLILSLNKGINLSKGKYIARMDADDIAFEDRLNLQFNFLEKNKDYMICGGWAKIIDEHGKETGRIKRITTDGLIRSNILFTTPYIHPTILIKSEILKETYYKENTTHCEDLDLWVRLAQRYTYKFANLPNYLIKYRWHSSNISVQHTDFQNDNRTKYILPFVKELIPDISNEQINLHFLSYKNSKIQANSNLIKAEKNWLVYLSKMNDKKKKFPKKDLDSLLFSRWIIFCLKIKKPFLIPFIKLPWYTPQNITQTFMLLLRK